MLTEIIIAGFGGQGVLFIGKCLAYAAMLENAEISWLPSYGPEMRGGTANCSVCISDAPIGSPYVSEPDILIAMNQPSLEKFLPHVKPGGVVFADSSMMDCTIEREDVTVIAVPASETADVQGLQGLGNVVLLGSLLKRCEPMLCGISEDAVKQALLKIIPPRKAALIEKNIEAMALGRAEIA